MKFLKIAGIVLIVILTIMGLGAGILGFGLFKGAKAVVKDVNKEVNQKIEKIDDEFVIKVPLKEKIGLNYRNINICKPSSADMFFEKIILEGNDGYSCFNHDCNIALKDNVKIPENFYMYVIDGNQECKKTKFDTKNHVKTIGYSATIEFTPELLKNLDIAQKKYKVSSENQNSYISWQIMGTKKISFTYDKRLNFDTLLINGKAKAKIEFLP